MMSSMNAIVPMACVTAAGIAAMVAEAFRDPGERMPIGGLGLVGLGGAAIGTLLLWNSNATSFGVVAADNFGLFVTWILIVVGALTIAISGPTIERERLPRGEYYALVLFATAGMMLAVFGTLLRLWHVAPTRAVVVTSVVSLVGLPLHWLLFGFEHMIELGLAENLIQMAMQGIFAGAGAIYLFTRSVVLLGAGRAAVFPSLVPGFTLLIGFLVLGEVPSLAQLIGFTIVLIGFRLVVKT